MPTSTANFGFQKPLVNNAIDADLWGGILNTNWDDVDSILTSFVPAIGDVELNITGTNPSSKYPISTTWVLVSEGRALVGLDSTDPDFNTAEETGGAKTHTLTVDEMPAHAHTISPISILNISNSSTGQVYMADPGGSLSTSTVGGGAAHNNLPPYYVVYVWKRTA
jgi:hypothetical protein